MDIIASSLHCFFYGRTSECFPVTNPIMCPMRQTIYPWDTLINWDDRYCFRFQVLPVLVPFMGSTVVERIRLWRPDVKLAGSNALTAGELLYSGAPCWPRSPSWKMMSLVKKVMIKGLHPLSELVCGLKVWGLICSTRNYRVSKCSVLERTRLFYLV